MCTSWLQRCSTRSILGGYNHYLRTKVGITSVGDFDSIRVRRFLTLSASAPTETSEDILYGLISEMVILF